MGIALTNATVVTCTGADPIVGGTVVIDGDRIAWVGPAAEAPSGHESIDCAGRTVVPGLCDAHVHLVYDYVKDTYDIELARPLEQAAVDAAVHAPGVLALGSTSCRHVGASGHIGVVASDAIPAACRPGRPRKPTPQLTAVWGAAGAFRPIDVYRGRQHAARLTEL